MTIIKNIIFDVNEVLTRRLHADDWSNNILAKEYDVPLSQLHAFFHEFIAAGTKTQGMTIEDFWKIKTVNIDPIPLSAITLSAKRHEDDLVINNEMIELLKTLQSNYHLFALTNSWSTGKSFKESLAGYFEAYVQSFEISLSKPNPAIFQYMFNAYNLIPKETLFIDNKQRNIESARGAGMQTVLFTNFTRLKIELAQLAIIKLK